MAGPAAGSRLSLRLATVDKLGVATWQTALAFALGGTVATQAAFELAESGVSVNEIEFLAGAAQVSAAIVATVTTRALRPAHGTIAAFITGAIVLYVNITGSRS